MNRYTCLYTISINTLIIILSYNFFNRITTQIFESILSINTYIFVCIHVL